MNDLISRKEAVDAILGLTNCDTVDELRAYVKGYDLGSWWSGGVLSSIGKMERLPSAEPKTPSNGSITSINPENTHDRTTGDLISREDACEAVKNEMESWLEGDRCDYRNVVDAIMDLPSAEKAQLSEEGTTFDIPSAEPERKKGEWIEFPNHMAYKCSECGRIIQTTDGRRNISKHYPFCHCGADMRGTT